MFDLNNVFYHFATMPDIIEKTPNSLHEMSTQFHWGWFLMAFIAAMGGLFGVIKWFIEKDRQALVDSCDKNDKEISEVKKDLGDFKVEVAKEYISTDTLMDLVVRPNNTAHEEIKETIATLDGKIENMPEKIVSIIKGKN